MVERICLLYSKFWVTEKAGPSPGLDHFPCVFPEKWSRPGIWSRPGLGQAWLLQLPANFDEFLFITEPVICLQNNINCSYRQKMCENMLEVKIFNFVTNTICVKIKKVHSCNLITWCLILECKKECINTDWWNSLCSLKRWKGQTNWSHWVFWNIQSYLIYLHDLFLKHIYLWTAQECDCSLSLHK